LNENVRLCADHFEDSQFKDRTKRNKLIASAIPTLFSVKNPPHKIKTLCQSPRPRFNKASHIDDVDNEPGAVNTLTSSSPDSSTGTDREISVSVCNSLERPYVIVDLSSDGSDNNSQHQVIRSTEDYGIEYGK